MQLLDLTLPSPEENLALDEALLQHPNAPEVFRLWESPLPFVVLGRSSNLRGEVDIEACGESSAPIHRRVSGGAAIVTGPGCLMFALVLNLNERPHLRAVDRAHSYVSHRMVKALRELIPTVVAAGTSDLAFQAEHREPLRKFSGNSIRVVKDRLLYHGALLYDANLNMISRLLRVPPRQPSYRASRSHEKFVSNLPTDSSKLRASLMKAWPTSCAFVVDETLAHSVEHLVRDRYSQDNWRHSR